MIYAIAFIVLHGCNPGLAALFAPAHAQMGRYEVCAEPGSIEQVIEEAGRQGINVSRIELMEPLDAFGASGSYDPSRLQQLYGGARPKVARGWRQDGDHFESLTLISPHPDAALRRLVPGTLVIRWII